jgi:hypothetical protein
MPCPYFRNQSNFSLKSNYLQLASQLLVLFLIQTMRTHNGPNNPTFTEKTHFTQHLDIPCNFPNSTASSSGLKTNSPAKIATPPNKPKSSSNTKRQSLYNTRPPKKPSITPVEIPIASVASSQCPQNNPPHLQNSRKRPNMM